MPLPLLLSRRESGQSSGGAFASAWTASRFASLRLSARGFTRGSPSGGLLCLALEPVAQGLLLAGGADGGVSLYDSCAGGVSEPLLRLRRGAAAHTYSCTACGWYPDGGGLFFSCSLDGSARGYDVDAGGAGVLRFGAPQPSPRDALLSLALPNSAGAPHGLLACGAADGRVRLFDPAAGGGLAELRGHADAVLALAWLPGAEHVLASGGADGQLRLWDVRTHGCLHMFDQYGGGAGGAGLACAHSGPLLALAPSADGALLFSLGADGRVRRWDAQTGRDTRLHISLAAAGAGAAPPTAGGTASGSSRLGTSIALSACGGVLFAPMPALPRAASGSAVALCARTGARLRALAGAHYGGAVRALALRRDSCELFTAGQDGFVRLWSGTPATTRVPLPPGDDAPDVGELSDVDEWDVDEEVDRGPRMAYAGRGY